ncbi:hypothetical protein B296_00007278 [Ensete ventricosum]|uniref:Uncharacterized protein n=1 Tax=Ensete ventricosum TaxID=4639 RepID=A0A427A808_ENSVE|nr:hypothetical protein B296_00007278 [Ensete ventricosum]
MRATASVGRLPSPPLSAGRNLVLLRPRPTSLPDPRVFASRSLAGTDPSPKNHPHRDRAHGWKRKEQGVGRGERGGAEEVHCEVDVVSWRERRVRAWILVNADVESVWSVLTDYERLADFVPNLVYRIVPNLAISKILSRDNNKVRVLQISLFQVIYEDLPSNLCSIRDAIEDRVGIKNDQHDYSDEHVGSNCDPLHDDKSGQNEPAPNGNAVCTIRQRPKVPGLQRDVEVLKAELTAFISKYGQGGFMPMRKQLRLHGRVDIEKAITRMGGFRRIADLMNLSLAYKHRKPKGYWDNLENLQEEVNGIFHKFFISFKFEEDSDQTCWPSKRAINSSKPSTGITCGSGIAIAIAIAMGTQEARRSEAEVAQEDRSSPPAGTMEEVQQGKHEPRRIWM